MLGKVSVIDEFGGTAVRSVWENSWPFTRARLVISADTIACTTPRGRPRAVRNATDDPTVMIIRYRYFPFCVRTVVWIDLTSRAGFVPYRERAVRRSLDAHGWRLDVRTKRWRTAIADARRSWRASVDTGELASP